MSEFKFKFSIVSAVYNVEEFIAEAVESLIQQDIGFKENVQLILVDDGSQDSSGSICDNYAKNYPDNIFVIHKENGGAASARNAGLKLAQGRYINFMDPDDKLTRNTLSKIYNFFPPNESEIDVVTIPMYLFEAQTGPYWQNWKFKRGSRVINLLAEYDAVLMSTATSFFKNQLKDEICFDSRLPCGEDMKVVLQILSKRMKLGVVSSCKYMYRKRNQGNPSLIQSTTKSYSWYFDYFTYLIDWGVEFFKNRFGFVPAYVQYLFMCDLQWRIWSTHDLPETFTAEEMEQYKKRLFGSFKFIEDRYVLAQRIIGVEHKNFVLSKKYERPTQISRCGDDAVLHFGNTVICRVSNLFIKLEFLKYKNKILSIEGFARLLGLEAESETEIFVLLNGEKINCELTHREELTEFRLDEQLCTGLGFKCNIPLDSDVEDYTIMFGVTLCGIDIVKKNLKFGKFFPLVKNPVNSYYYVDGLLVTSKSNSLILHRSNNFGWIKQEQALFKELWNTKKTAVRKAAILRCLYYLLKPLYRNKIWLLSDRVNKADDNGEALFRYINENKIPVNSYFVIKKDSADYPILKNTGKVLNYLSRKHKLLHLLADNIVSAAADDYVYNPFGRNEKYYRDILRRKKRIFLQHGIIKDDLSSWLSRYNKDLTIFITSATPEYNSVLSGNYHYSKDVVKLTGLSRYDQLEDRRKKVISIMPTWRLNLCKNVPSPAGTKRYDCSFVNSSFFTFYNELLNNKYLLEAADRNGYQIKFFPHPNVMPAVGYFTKNNRVLFCSEADKYRDIFAESSLVVTDYSSVAFDFAYLRKPVLYCQFDRETFFQGQVYDKGYFDYEKDGFGEVETNLEDTVNRIIEYMENGCQLKTKYRERINNFYAFNDKGNCARIVKEILSLND